MILFSSPSSQPQIPPLVLPSARLSLSYPPLTKIKCEGGWYGVDCSIPSTDVPVEEWPLWLNSSSVDEPYANRNMGTCDAGIIRAIVSKKRPLIYVYDLPSELNIHFIQGRPLKFNCVNRLYDENNRTDWISYLHAAQMALYESILASPHRTSNAEEADYFLVPLFDQCAVLRAYDAPHSPIEAKGHLNLRIYFAMESYKKGYEHILQNYPYWNRSSGRDHLWFFGWDEGACLAPKEIENSILLTHWGNTNSKHNYSTSSFIHDGWNVIPGRIRGDHVCFDPEKDIVLPAWKKPDPLDLSETRWRRSRKERKRFFYFRGDLGEKYVGGRHEVRYSIGIRQKIAKEFGSSLTWDGNLGRQHTDDVIMGSEKTTSYHDDLSQSIFCGVFPGDGWSGRMEDSVLHGCIPVIIQDGVQMPFENVFNYDSFAVRIKEEDIPNMISILRGINETKIESMLRNVQSIWPRFIYRYPVMLEAERQKNLFGDNEAWAIEYSKILEDDAFSTFIQVLHYKLHNDPWRKSFQVKHKEFGLKEECRTTAIHGKDHAPQ